MIARCEVCFRHCRLEEGSIGFCGARINTGGKVRAANYGMVTSLALDPIEKKPLRRFYPGKRILSTGSYGCNLRCPFCQNHEISWSEEAFRYRNHSRQIQPDEMAAIAVQYQDEGNLGVAFTYNEPLVGYEYVRDTARLVKEKGLRNVLVTNGTAELSVLFEILPFMDAMNIDLKGFTDHYYQDVLHGNRKMVLDFIAEAAKHCHVELTTLIVPGENDTVEEMRELTRWVSGLRGKDGGRIGPSIPLHITRFFPRFHMTDRDSTAVEKIFLLTRTAQEYLEYVYPGNIF